MSKDTIILKCYACGNKDEYPREADPSIPANVATIVLNECPECEAASGGYGTEDWYDKDGSIVVPK